MRGLFGTWELGRWEVTLKPNCCGAVMMAVIIDQDSARTVRALNVKLSWCELTLSDVPRDTTLSHRVTTITSDISCSKLTRQCATHPLN